MKRRAGKLLLWLEAQLDRASLAVGRLADSMLGGPPSPVTQLDAWLETIVVRCPMHGPGCGPDCDRRLL